MRLADKKRAAEWDQAIGVVRALVAVIQGRGLDQYHMIYCTCDVCVCGRSEARAAVKAAKKLRGFKR